MSRRAAKGEYIETETGNKVSRKANLTGTTHIMLGGKSVLQADVMIRGDLVRTAPSSSTSSTTMSATAAAADNGSSGSSSSKTSTSVAIGRYVFLAPGVTLHPPSRLYRGHFTHFPLRLGDHVYIGASSVVSAASVGSHVHIGADVVVGDFAIIKDYVQILDGTVVPPHSVIPSFSIIGGRPGRVVGEVPEGMVGEWEGKELYRAVGNNPVPPAGVER